jgi:hypothetical protein
MKAWAYPAVVLVAWVAFAAWTLSALATVQPSLRAAAAIESPASPSEPTVPVSMPLRHAPTTAAGRICLACKQHASARAGDSAD